MKCRKCFNKVDKLGVHTCSPQKELDCFKQATDNLLKKFYLTYFVEEEELDEFEFDKYDIHKIGEETHGVGVIEMNEYYFDLEFIQIAIMHNVDKRILFEYYEYEENKNSLNEKPKCHFYSYIKGCKVYTEEEKKKDEAKIKKAYEDLKEMIKT